jgi:hypothetical protein
MEKKWLLLPWNFHSFTKIVLLTVKLSMFHKNCSTFIKTFELSQLFIQSCSQIVTIFFTVSRKWFKFYQNLQREKKNCSICIETLKTIRFSFQGFIRKFIFIEHNFLLTISQKLLHFIKTFKVFQNRSTFIETLKVSQNCSTIFIKKFKVSQNCSTIIETFKSSQFLF